MKVDLKDSVVRVVESHRLWLVQKCKIPGKYHSELAAHLFRLCAFIGLVPQSISHNSPILKIKNGREILVNFGVNRYFLTAVLDYAMRRKTVGEGLASQFKRTLPSLVRGKWSQIWKTVPTEYHVDHCMADALELMFGGNAQFRPFIPSGKLIAGSNYKKTSKNSDVSEYREFYSVDLNATFYAKESVVSDWGDAIEWRFITQHPHGFPVLSNSRGRCLPRLAVTMAVRQFVRMELGNISDWEDELVPELRQSLLSRDNHQDMGEFPWEAFFQSEMCRNPERAREIINAENVITTGGVDKARYCGLTIDQYKSSKKRLMDDAKVWFDEVGVNLD